jgi:hypothetical protein
MTCRETVNRRREQINQRQQRRLLVGRHRKAEGAGRPAAVDESQDSRENEATVKERHRNEENETEALSDRWMC